MEDRQDLELCNVLLARFTSVISCSILISHLDDVCCTSFCDETISRSNFLNHAISTLHYLYFSSTLQVGRIYLLQLPDVPCKLLPTVGTLEPHIKPSLCLAHIHIRRPSQDVWNRTWSGPLLFSPTVQWITHSNSRTLPRAGAVSLPF